MEFFHQGEGEQARVGAMLAVTSNPLTTLFFVSYALWVVLYLALAMLTWRSPASHCLTLGRGRDRPAGSLPLTRTPPVLGEVGALYQVHLAGVP